MHACWIDASEGVNDRARAAAVESDDARRRAGRMFGARRRGASGRVRGERSTRYTRHGRGESELRVCPVEARRVTRGSGTVCRAGCLEQGPVGTGAGIVYIRPRCNLRVAAARMGLFATCHRTRLPVRARLGAYDGARRSGRPGDQDERGHEAPCRDSTGWLSHCAEIITIGDRPRNTEPRHGVVRLRARCSSETHRSLPVAAPYVAPHVSGPHEN